MPRSTRMAGEGGRACSGMTGSTRTAHGFSCDAGNCKTRRPCRRGIWRGDLRSPTLHYDSCFLEKLLLSPSLSAVGVPADRPLWDPKRASPLQQFSRPAKSANGLKGQCSRPLLSCVKSPASIPSEGKGSAIHGGVSRGRVHCLKNRLFHLAATITNAGMVNAHDACSNRADFCIFFATSGRFLLFKNPVKYN